MRFAFSRAVAWVFLVSAFACCTVSAQQVTAFLPNPDPPEFISFVQPDLRVVLAREQVIEIFSTTNSCSLWFQRMDRNAAATFASLKFRIDFDGAPYVIGSPSGSGAMLYVQPYSGRAFENAGGGSVITLNAYGAFFIRSARVMQRDIPGSSFHYAGWRILHIGSYPGNTPGAQVTTLLHEFGHVIGRLPADPDTLSGLSARNTAEVLRFCHQQIDAANRAIRRLQP